MKQGAIGRWALLGAAVVAAFALGLAVTREQQPAPPPVATASPDTIQALEQRTEAQAQDVSAWRQLGAAYFERERYDDAARAYDRASALAPQTAAIWSALGEARVMASTRDPMPAQAAAAFERALALDPRDPRARYFLAVKRDLAGDHAGAIGDWLALLADSPAEAPWRADLIRTIEQVGKIHKIEVAARLAAAQAKAPPPTLPPAARGIPGPTAEDLAAARAIPPGEQRQMAEGMVARLEARLKANPKDADGWIMLMRSRSTLGQSDKARQALADAIAANPDKVAMLRQQADVLGIR